MLIYTWVIEITLSHCNKLFRCLNKKPSNVNPYLMLWYNLLHTTALFQALKARNHLLRLWDRLFSCCSDLHVYYLIRRPCWSDEGGVGTCGYFMQISGRGSQLFEYTAANGRWSVDRSMVRWSFDSGVEGLKTTDDCVYCRKVMSGDCISSMTSVVTGTLPETNVPRVLLLRAGKANRGFRDFSQLWAGPLFTQV